MSNTAQPNILQTTIPLGSTGLQMPLFGLGTWRSPPGAVGFAVSQALSCGYRHIDCAAIYGNEEEIGVALEESFNNPALNLQRSDIFLTSKIWNFDHRPEDSRRALEEINRKLKIQYLDLLLIHWPVSWKKQSASGEREFDSISLLDCWRGLEALVEAGLVKTLGLSNFSIEQVDEILAGARIRPCMNQVELHPYFPQKEFCAAMKSRGLSVTAYCPLGNLSRAPGEVNWEESPLKHPTVLEIAAKHGKSPAQVVLSWHFRHSSWVIIPKSVTPARIVENSQVFHLSEEEFEALERLGEKNLRFVNPDFLPNGKRLFD